MIGKIDGEGKEDFKTDSEIMKRRKRGEGERERKREVNERVKEGEK